MKVTFLDKEHSLNKILRAQKSTKANLKILFTSLWDPYSVSLVQKLKEANTDKGMPLYVVDSYEMPHSFVIYRTSKVPQLVSLRGSRVSSEDYLPRIYKDLHIQ